MELVCGRERIEHLLGPREHLGKVRLHELEHVERLREVHREHLDREREHLRGLYREQERVDEHRNLRLEHVGRMELVRGHEREELLLGHQEQHKKDRLRQFEQVERLRGSLPSRCRRHR